MTYNTPSLTVSVVQPYLTLVVVTYLLCRQINRLLASFS